MRARRLAPSPRRSMPPHRRAQIAYQSPAMPLTPSRTKLVVSDVALSAADCLALQANIRRYVTGTDAAVQTSTLTRNGGPIPPSHRCSCGSRELSRLPLPRRDRPGLAFTNGAQSTRETLAGDFRGLSGTQHSDARRATAPCGRATVALLSPFPPMTPLRRQSGSPAGITDSGPTQEKAINLPRIGLVLRSR